MSADDALLFIDANKYLDLYRTDKGKKLLAPLGEQIDHIFVTQQVVDEVQRNKILVAAGFLDEKFKALKLQSFNVPDHLSGTSAGQNKEILQQMGEIGQKVKKLNKEVNALALGILEKISRSKDEISTALTSIFAKAVAHSPDELHRARERRELGNPPGKSANPIGDQLTWEQILTYFKGKKRLWIISRDGDYGTVFDGKGFLNHFLYEELRKMEPASEAYLFEDTVVGIKHFVDTTDVKAKQRLTPDDEREIEIEEKAIRQYSGAELRDAEDILRIADLPLQDVLAGLSRRDERVVAAFATVVARRTGKGIPEVIRSIFDSLDTQDVLANSQKALDDAIKLLGNTETGQK